MLSSCSRDMKICCMLAAEPASAAMGCTSTARLLAHPDFSWSAEINTFSAASLWEVPKRSLGEFCLVDSKRSPAGQPWALGQGQGHWGTQHARAVFGYRRASRLLLLLAHMLVQQISQAIISCFRQQAHAELQLVVPHAVAHHHKASVSC